MKSLFKKIYLFIESLPDHVYPFASEVEGRLVRGQRSYKKAVAQALETYGPNRLGYKLTVYRGVFHFLGSVLFILCAAVISRNFFGSEVALYVLVAAATLALFFQEFYSHPKRFQQPRKKGVTDWLTWVVPMMLYISFFSF